MDKRNTAPPRANVRLALSPSTRSPPLSRLNPADTALPVTSARSPLSAPALWPASPDPARSTSAAAVPSG